MASRDTLMGLGFVCLVCWIALAESSAQDIPLASEIPEHEKTQIVVTLGSDFSSPWFQVLAELHTLYEGFPVEEFLLELLHDENQPGRVRERAVAWLGLVQDPDGCDAILQMAKDLSAAPVSIEDEDMRLLVACITALGYCGGEDGVDFLKQTMTRRFWMSRGFFQGEERDGEFRALFSLMGTSSAALVVADAHTTEELNRIIPSEFSNLVPNFLTQLEEFRQLQRDYPAIVRESDKRGD